MCRVLAAPRKYGGRPGHLPARRDARWALRRRWRRTEGGERLLPARDPVRGRGQPPLAARRDGRSAGLHFEGMTMHVTRQRRRVSGVRLGLFGRYGRRFRILVAGTAALAVAGGGVAYASTEVFGKNHVGTEYANGLQVSGDQILKPLGDRLMTQFGKFMGSTISPDGRYLAATSTDRSVVLQIFDLQSYKLIWTVGSASGVKQTLSDGTVGQEGPTYSPDGKFLWLPEANGIRRFPVND